MQLSEGVTANAELWDSLVFTPHLSMSVPDLPRIMRSTRQAVMSHMQQRAKCKRNSVDRTDFPGQTVYMCTCPC